MAQIDENTVSVEHQIKVLQRALMIHPEGKGLRVMFVGNSITHHMPAPAIGWNYDWGMAASAPEKDYVHLCMDCIKKIHPDPAFCICGAGRWEMNWKNGESVFEEYQSAREFKADVIILRMIENCAKDGEKDHFAREWEKYVDFLDGTGKARLIVTTSFWRHPMDEVIRDFAARRGQPLVELGDLGGNAAMKAYGLFEHKGVASHPGDLGMAEIAARIMKVF